MEIYRKIFAWILILIGLAIIVASLYYSYKIFIEAKSPPGIFNIKETPQETKNQLPKDFQEQIKNIVQEQIKNLLPQEYVNKLLNLISWSFFVGIAIFAGSQIANIGIKLLNAKA
jgi:hypothetical protein